MAGCKEIKRKRTSTCWRCKFFGGPHDHALVSRDLCLCKATRHQVPLYRAYYCENFISQDPPRLVFDAEGIAIRNRTSLDYRTEKQWRDVRRQLKEGAVGVKMKPTEQSWRLVTYYLIDDTYPT